ncbi:MAG: DUF423 domain-containing protein [Opitutaceae bacterium]|nr:DUF423 domain-containing protein [Cytophagales bacterium]
MQKLFLLTASISGAISVMIGAFGAHGLRKFLEENGRMDTFETAVKYQFYHSLALFLLGILMFHVQHKFLEYAGYSYMLGMLIFSGSLYILCLSGYRWLGAITPIGGLCLIAGWILIALAIGKSLS